ncbi:MAG TPA: PaaI family thioesterase [Hyphomonas sp.]|nr:thioesterase [Hyphomonas sp.]HRJ00196.1 PaaI family thioesterase [Hyphomonas sp.]
MNPDLTNPRADEIDTILKGMPFAQSLGMRCEILGDEMTAILPFQEKLIGNVTIRALHGGAIASFLELTAMLQVFLVSDMARPPRPINITIDYLRQGHAKDLYARAFVMKMGRRMASVRAEAWQETRNDPVSAITAHFMIPQPDPAP